MQTISDFTYVVAIIDGPKPKPHRGQKQLRQGVKLRLGGSKQADALANGMQMLAGVTMVWPRLDYVGEGQVNGLPAGYHYVIRFRASSQAGFQKAVRACRHRQWQPPRHLEDVPVSAN